jgi:3-isopropylmalate dehydrogenase
MMLRYSLNLGAEATAVEEAVKKVLDDGLRTRDLGGDASTVEVGDAVAAELKSILTK